MSPVSNIMKGGLMKGFDILTNTLNGRVPLKIKRTEDSLILTFKKIMLFIKDGKVYKTRKI